MYLTASEQLALERLASVWDLIATEDVHRGPSAEADLAELSIHVHAIQNMLLAQAAARAYPDRYRLLGGQCVDAPD